MYTHCLRIVSTVSTPYLQLVYNVSTTCLHCVYRMPAQCVYYVCTHLIDCTWSLYATCILNLSTLHAQYFQLDHRCIHIVYCVSRPCLHLVYTLSNPCLHLVYSLSIHTCDDIPPWHARRTNRVSTAGHALVLAGHAASTRTTGHAVRGGPDHMATHRRMR